MTIQPLPIFLYCTALLSSALHYTTINFTFILGTALNLYVIYYTTLNCTVIHWLCTALHQTAPHHSVLHLPSPSLIPSLIYQCDICGHKDTTANNIYSVHLKSGGQYRIVVQSTISLTKLEKHTCNQNLCLVSIIFPIILQNFKFYTKANL